MSIDMSTEAKSDQQNADDYMAGPRTVTVEKVTRGSAEQPVDIHLVEFPGKPFKPSKTCRRILVAAWGPDASNYAGRRMTLYRDPEVRFGGMAIGGIRISHLSHIAEPMNLALAVSKGKRATYRVEPLGEVGPAEVAQSNGPPEPTAEQVAACTDTDTLGGMWRASGPERRAQIEARVAELKAAPEPAEDVEALLFDAPTDGGVK